MATVTFKSLLVAILPAVIIATVVVSCKQEGEKGPGVFVPTPNDTSALGKINHFITVPEIENFKKAFSVQRDSLARLMPNLFIPASETFNKQALLNILVDSNAVGMRIYYGLKPGGNRNEFRLVLVGVDAQGRDLYYTGTAAENGKLGARIPPPPPQGGVEYGQCTPPCFLETNNP